MTKDQRSLHDLIDSFLSQRRMAHPDRARQVLRIALGRVQRPADLVRASWISFATVEVYLGYEGGGYGPRRTLSLLESFVCWLGEVELLRAWDVSCLLYRLDEQRSANGADRRGHAAAWERLVDFEHVDAVGREFIEAVAGLSEVDLAVGVSAVRVLGCCSSWHGVVRFGAVDPDDVAAFLLEQDRDKPGDALADAAFCRVAAAFYAWLSQERRMSPQRAQRISARFAQHALAFNVVRMAS